MKGVAGERAPENHQREVSLETDTICLQHTTGGFETELYKMGLARSMKRDVRSNESLEWSLLYHLWPPGVERHKGS